MAKKRKADNALRKATTWSMGPINGMIKRKRSKRKP